MSTKLLTMLFVITLPLTQLNAGAGASIELGPKGKEPLTDEDIEREKGAPCAQVQEELAPQYERVFAFSDRDYSPHDGVCTSKRACSQRQGPPKLVRPTAAVPTRREIQPPQILKACTPGLLGFEYWLAWTRHNHTIRGVTPKSSQATLEKLAEDYLRALPQDRQQYKIPVAWRPQESIKSVFAYLSDSSKLVVLEQARQEQLSETLVWFIKKTKHMDNWESEKVCDALNDKEKEELYAHILERTYSVATQEA